MTKMPRMLTVAGSDSGGGAGIQADVRTGTLLGCHVSTALTAVTVQNSLGVTGVHAIPPTTVAAQINTVLGDIGADAVKTGMLHDADLIDAVAFALRENGVKNLVVDPVMAAKGGSSLLAPDAVGALKELLLPLALLVTPNLPEAEALTGVKVTDRKSAGRAAEALKALGPKAVLIKGGHGTGGTVTDLLLLPDGREVEFLSPRIGTEHTHGTGCTLSAAIAANLSRGEALSDAVAHAHAFLHAAIVSAYPTGAGHGSTNPWRAARAGEGAVLEGLYRAWGILEAANPWGLVPEVQSNLAEMLPGAESFADVAAFPGRIIRVGRRIGRLEGPRFGASRHMAKILLAGALRKSPFRAVMNIRYGEDVLAAVKAAGFSASGFDRADEPADVREKEGSSLEWGTGWVLDRAISAPDAIFDPGGPGKEPMVRVFGRDAEEVAARVVAIWKTLEGGEGEGN